MVNSFNNRTALARFKIKEFITYSLGVDNVKLTACLVYYFFKTNSRTLYRDEVNLLQYYDYVDFISLGLILFFLNGLALMLKYLL